MTPRPIAPHEGHALLAVTGVVDAATRLGFLACLTCSELVRPLRRCGARTRDGGLCRVFLREDLGYERCWSHGEGAGATNRPRRRAS